MRDWAWVKSRLPAIHDTMSLLWASGDIHVDTSPACSTGAVLVAKFYRLAVQDDQPAARGKITSPECAMASHWCVSHPAPKKGGAADGRPVDLSVSMAPGRSLLDGSLLLLRAARAVLLDDLAALLDVGPAEVGGGAGALQTRGADLVLGRPEEREAGGAARRVTAC